MSIRRKTIYYVLSLIVLVVVLSVATTNLSLGGVIVAPASLDGKVTISTYSDGTRIFITYASNNPTFLRRLFHSTTIGAFVVQQRTPLRKPITHAGDAHVDFGNDLLNIEFSDASFIFTVKPDGSIPPGPAVVDYAAGLATYHVPFMSSHSLFVASHDWNKNSCGIF